MISVPQAAAMQRLYNAIDKAAAALLIAGYERTAAELRQSWMAVRQAFFVIKRKND